MTVFASIVFITAAFGQSVSQGSPVVPSNAIIETQNGFTTSLSSLHLTPETLKWGDAVKGVKISLSVLPKNPKIDFLNRPILLVTVCNNSQSTLTIQTVNNRLMLTIFTVVNGVSTFLYPNVQEVRSGGNTPIKPNEMMSFAYPFDIQSCDPQLVPFAAHISVKDEQSKTRISLLSNVVNGDDISKNVK